jgi:hypothetical protein
MIRETFSASVIGAIPGATPIQPAFGNWQKNLLGYDNMPIFLKGANREIDKIHGNQDSHYPKDRQVPVLPKRGYPCGDCPLQKRHDPGAGSLREAFKAVEKRAGKRNAKAKN